MGVMLRPGENPEPTEEEIAPCSADPLPPGSPEDVAQVEEAFQEVTSG